MNEALTDELISDLLSDAADLGLLAIGLPDDQICYADWGVYS
jgi:hypothetical protein